MNLLAPRETSQGGQQWRDDITYVQLKYTFLNSGTGEPITLGRTFMTFYDFDTGRQTYGNDNALAGVSQRECIQMQGTTDIQVNIHPLCLCLTVGPSQTNALLTRMIITHPLQEGLLLT